MRFSSPNNSPQGLKIFERSNIIFKTATIGNARNIPEIPAKLPEINTPSIAAKALILTLEPTILGIKIGWSAN